MRHFLVVYDRARGAVLRVDDLGEDLLAATTVRMAEESKVRTDPNIEVVVLSADSKETLLRTHARYFRSLSELTSHFASLAAKAS